MQRKSGYWLVVLLVVAALGLAPLVACSMGGAQSTFCDAGEGDLDFTDDGDGFGKYSLFRFDTAAAPRALTTPGAADMMSTLSSPAAGQVILFAVSADGANPVNLTGGEGVTVRPSAAAVLGNSTLLVYCVVDSTASDDQRVTIY